MTEVQFWRLFEVAALLTAVVVLVPVLAVPRLLGRLLRELAEDAEVRRQARTLGVVAAWLLLLGSLVRIAWDGVDVGARTWFALLTAVAWFAAIVAADTGWLSSLAVLGRLTARLGRLLDPQRPPASAEAPADRKAA